MKRFEKILELANKNKIPETLTGVQNTWQQKESFYREAIAKEAAWHGWIAQEETHWDYAAATMDFGTFQQECPGILYEQFERWWLEELTEV